MENKKLLKQSFDMKYFRTQCITISAIVGGVLLLACLLSMGTAQMVTLWGSVVYLLLFLPWILYYVWRMWEIYRNADRYVLYEATARKAYPAFGRKVYFEVEISQQDGTAVTLETKGVFSLSILTDRYWGNSMGQRLEILYDESEERVVVIRRLED